MDIISYRTRSDCWYIRGKILDKRGQSLWLNIALGIVHALVDEFLFDQFRATGVTRSNIWSMNSMDKLQG
jgi:uncharacterized membrane protein YeaQ/YmgE (transglycosylase-associated protein family)